MAETIEVAVGPLYAQLHDKFSEQVGEPYDEDLRQQIESFLHQYNQSLERQIEQQQPQVQVQQPEPEAESDEPDE